jgi:Na+:H+ antiporter, NhaA family
MKSLRFSIERLLRTEAASGIVLLIASLVALGCANGPAALSERYAAFWQRSIRISFAHESYAGDARFLINECLMSVFFFLVGLEIRREIHQGELSQLRRAALPIAAALGGMMVPALIYLTLNVGTPNARGWGVPMATDIAFAVSVLALLGKRVPPALRVLLLTLAIADDIGAIVVIAVFYSGKLVLSGLWLVAFGMALIAALQRFGARRVWVYALPALVVWAGTHHAGIHPTLAAVALGLITPVRAYGDASESPAQQLQHRLHPLAAFVIVPLFALANAGVALRGVSASDCIDPVFLGISLGLVLGKPLGILLFARLAVAARIATLPSGVGTREITLLGLCAGIGFTMAVFVSELAFTGSHERTIAKLAIVAASAASATLARTLGPSLLKRRPTPAEPKATTETEAEQSTEL